MSGIINEVKVGPFTVTFFDRGVREGLQQVSVEVTNIAPKIVTTAAREAALIYVNELVPIETGRLMRSAKVTYQVSFAGEVQAELMYDAVDPKSGIHYALIQELEFERKRLPERQWHYVETGVEELYVESGDYLNRIVVMLSPILM